MGGADPASPFLHLLGRDRTKYGVISAGTYRAREPGELALASTVGLIPEERAIAESGFRILIDHDLDGLNVQKAPAFRRGNRSRNPK
ncbi:hypothetical protein [Bradyrhizobium iriomotense]|uniref:Glycine cleavage T-protein C-terminal barrel domain-containing protein n=1 Tax=Bradyrhizobium iriomotense TaxID=441950 RepID=A0ABQ6AZM4_9BRAD|nr:hypothetical protein [Bradyrhizobium iriomotense]GLR85358.1 hypothetical protein GCM10007857_20690 [Bradyrhizobium iriomotense]